MKQKSKRSKPKDKDKSSNTMSQQSKEPALYTHREMLKIPGQSPTGASQISLMTYNVLAQSLINRKRFPSSGSALRWAGRSRALFQEIGDYSPDILCLQEVDVLSWEPEWMPCLRTNGYEAIFYGSKSKKHGVAIAFKNEIFSYLSKTTIQYDEEITEGMERSKTTDNVALLICLTFKSEHFDTPPKRNGIIVGTTHLYWHAFASYERTRQILVLLTSYKRFSADIRQKYGNLNFYNFLAGDLNSQPFDASYISLTTKPVHFEGITKNGLGRSISHDWGDTANCEDSEPDPPQFDFTPSVLQQIESIQNLHNGIDVRAISLYSMAYHLVHPENSGLNNDRNEPPFSNWTDDWKGLLDYICVVCEWDRDNSSELDNLENFTISTGVKLMALLRMPTVEEMGPNGLPQPKQYPSDHLCMIAKMELI